MSRRSWTLSPAVTTSCLSFSYSLTPLPAHGFFSFFQLLMNYQQLIINLENIIHSQHHCKKIVQEYFIQVGWDRRRAAEGCWVLETVSFVDDSPGCSLHCRCHSVPDTEPYMRGSTFCVRVCVCACMHQCECVYLHLSTCQFTPVQK